MSATKTIKTVTSEAISQPPGGAMQTITEVTFEFEIVSMQLTSTFTMKALQLRSASNVVTMQLPLPQQPESALTLELSFEVAKIQPFAGAFGTIRIVPSQQRRSTPGGLPSFAVAGFQVVPTFESAPVQLTPSRQGRTSVLVTVPFQITTLEFSPSLQIGSVTLRSNSKQVAVQLPGAVLPATQRMPIFEIANLQLSDIGEILLMQLNVVGYGTRREVSLHTQELYVQPSFSPRLFAKESGSQDLQPFRVALRENQKLVDYAVTPRLRVEVHIPQLRTREEFLDRLVLDDLGTTVDLTRWLRSDADPEQLAFLAAYPSGEIRAVSAETTREDNRTLVNFVDPVCFFDPAISTDDFQIGEERVEFDLVALRLPSIA
jgi:hypothetical protein